MLCPRKVRGKTFGGDTVVLTQGVLRVIFIAAYIAALVVGALVAGYATFSEGARVAALISLLGSAALYVERQQSEDQETSYRFKQWRSRLLMLVFLGPISILLMSFGHWQIALVMLAVFLVIMLVHGVWVRVEYSSLEDQRRESARVARGASRVSK